jgi:hypothetical protein
MGDKETRMTAIATRIAVLVIAAMTLTAPLARASADAAAQGLPILRRSTSGPDHFILVPGSATVRVDILPDPNPDDIVIEPECGPITHFGRECELPEGYTGKFVAKLYMKVGNTWVPKDRLELKR